MVFVFDDFDFAHIMGGPSDETLDDIIHYRSFGGRLET